MKRNDDIIFQFYYKIKKNINYIDKANYYYFSITIFNLLDK